MEEKFKANILEIGVGTAKIALDICQAGIPVTGVDCSSDMLAIAEKKKKQMLKEDPNLLQLVEQDILQLNLGKKYSHILLTDGFLQHFTLLDEHRSILAKVKEHLAEDGWLAIDLVLPPSQSKWSFTDRKRLTDQKHLYKQVEGETSLQRQLFRYKVTYEMFNDHVEELRYRVERELALILSRELALLLESEGFQVRCIQENYGNTSQHSWKEIYDKNTELPTPYLDLQESLEGLDDLGSALPYQHLAWGNGGYPFSETLPQREAGSPTRFTLLSKLK